MDKNNTDNTNNKKDKKTEMLEWIKAIIFAVILAIFIRAFVFEMVQIQQSSMYPTLHSGDKCAVWKAGYIFDDPERGDIVIANVPGGKRYVKRVIALEGETIEIIDSTVYVNDEILEENYLPDGLEYEDYPKTTIPEGTYFLMGDNRPTSIDSRSGHIGFIGEKDIIGRVFLRVSPMTWYN